MISHRHTKSTGFTLVEMIVVIALAGILAAIAYASYSDARAQARDRIRMVQLDQLQVAIELYKDEHGRYPERGCRASAWPLRPQWPQWAGPTGGIAAGNWNESCEEYILGLVPDYIDELPVDPRPRGATSNANIYYSTNNTGTEYQILHHMTVESLVTDSAKSSPYSRYTSCGAFQPNSYSVHTAGAACW